VIEATSPAAIVRPVAAQKARVEPIADTDTAWVRLVFTYVSWATVCNHQGIGAKTK
jgi:hypothetical protein